jgi:hypothetical protein
MAAACRSRTRPTARRPEKKAGGPRDADGGYDDNNGNCGGKARPKGPGQLVPVNKANDPKKVENIKKVDDVKKADDVKKTDEAAPVAAVADPVKTASVTEAAPAISVRSLITAPGAAVAPVAVSDMPVTALVSAPIMVTLPNGTVVPLPLGAAITVPLGVQVSVLSPPTAASVPGAVMATAASAPASAVLGVSVSIPAGTVVSVNGVGTVTLNEPLEAVLGEQVVRAPLQVVLPSSLPRTGGLGGLTGLLSIAAGIAATAGGAYLRRRGGAAS